MPDTTFTTVAATTFTGAVVGNVTGNVTGAVQNTVEAASTNGAVAIASKTVYLTKAGVAAMTLATPTATTHDGIRITFIATTANAHTVTCPAGKLQGSAVGTFGGAVGDTMTVEAYQGIWYILTKTNVTLS